MNSKTNYKHTWANEGVDLDKIERLVWPEGLEDGLLKLFEKKRAGSHVVIGETGDVNIQHESGRWNCKM